MRVNVDKNVNNLGTATIFVLRQNLFCGQFFKKEK